MGADDSAAPDASEPSGTSVTSADPDNVSSSSVPSQSDQATPLTAPLPSVSLPSITLPSITHPPLPTPPVGGLPSAQPAAGLGDDPTLDALAQACEVGDMSACDTLYDGAPAGSSYGVYGDTCGGRQPANTGLLCTSVFPIAAPTTA